MTIDIEGPKTLNDEQLDMIIDSNMEGRNLED